MLELERANARQEEQLFHEARALVGVPAEQEILQHGGVLEQLDVLERPRDAAPGDLVRRHPRDVLAAEDEPAAGGVVDAGHEIEDRRLAGAIRPDDREHLARLDLEAYAGQRGDAPEVDGEVVRLEQRHRSRSERMYAFCRLNVARL